MMDPLTLAGDLSGCPGWHGRARRLDRLRDVAKASQFKGENQYTKSLSAPGAESQTNPSKEVARTIAELEKFYVILAGWGWKSPRK